MRHFYNFPVIISLFLLQIIAKPTFGQSQNLGDYQIPVLPGWAYNADKSTADYYLFINGQQKIEVAFKKEPTPCLNPAEFTKLILPVIQTLQKERFNLKILILNVPLRILCGTL